MLFTFSTFMFPFSQLHVVYSIYIYVIFSHLYVVYSIYIYITFQSVTCCSHYLHLCYVSVSNMWFTLFTFMLRFSQLHVVYIIYIYVTFQSVTC